MSTCARWCVLMVVLALTAASAGSAAAAWRPARVIAENAEPRVAAELSSGGIVLWASGSGAERFAWLPGSEGLTRSALPEFATKAHGSATWATNDRGDVVMIARRHGRIHALAVDWTGGQAAITVPAPEEGKIGKAVARIGRDGTALVAWTAMGMEKGRTRRFVWLRARAAGGAFAQAVRVAVDGIWDVGVQPDGLVQLVYAHGQAIFASELLPGAPAGAPTRIATIDRVPLALALVAGGSGVGRVLFTLERETGAFIPPEELFAAMRTADAAWTSPVRIARGRQLVFESLSAALASSHDGSAVVAYERLGRITVLRAGAGEAFGAPTIVGRESDGWLAYAVRPALGSAGDVLVSWIEQSVEAGQRFGDVCGYPCHERVMAVVAAPDGRFGTPQAVSPLGTTTSEGGFLNSEGGPVVATSSTGERLVAWQAGPGAAQDAGALLAARGDPSVSTPPPSDHRRPRLSVRVSLASLRAAAAGKSLRTRVRCSERCAVRITVLSTRDQAQRDLDDLRAVVLRHAGAQTVRLRLDRAQRRTLSRLLRLGGLWITAHATDAAGNLRSTRIKL